MLAVSTIYVQAILRLEPPLAYSAFTPLSADRKAHKRKPRKPRGIKWSLAGSVGILHFPTIVIDFHTFLRASFVVNLRTNHKFIDFHLDFHTDLHNSWNSGPLRKLS